MTSFMESLRRGLDRAGFEADKLMRYNRVHAEAARIQGQAHEQLQALGERVLELYKSGGLRHGELEAPARAVQDLLDQAKQKENEATAIQAEVWVEPPPLPPLPSSDTPPPPAVQATPPPAPPSWAAPAPAPPPPPAWTPPPAAPIPAAAPVWTPPPAAPQVALPDEGTRRMPPPDQQQYCQTCGAALRPHAVFCAQCGTRV